MYTEKIKAIFKRDGLSEIQQEFLLQSFEGFDQSHMAELVELLDENPELTEIFYENYRRKCDLVTNFSQEKMELLLQDEMRMVMAAA